MSEIVVEYRSWKNMIVWLNGFIDKLLTLKANALLIKAIGFACNYPSTYHHNDEDKLFEHEFESYLIKEYGFGNYSLRFGS